MDVERHFNYLCRVCMTNTKIKNSVVECVHILNKPTLKDQLQKYLNLLVTEFDALPKIICMSCFNQIESIASLSKIAEHTQKMLSEFVRTRKKKSVRISDPYPSVFNSAGLANTIGVLKDRKISDTILNEESTERQINVIQTRNCYESNFNTRSVALNAADAEITYAANAIQNSPSNDKNHRHQMVGVQENSSNVLQQKRRNLKMALSNVASACHSVVMSSPQRKTSTQFPMDSKCATLRKFREGHLQRATSQTVEFVPNQTKTDKVFSDNILLGNVVRDTDLLKLILKALKWPWNKTTLEYQIQRLKSSKFKDIMTDSNLLQDTDLTQILGPLLSPPSINLSQQTMQCVPISCIQQTSKPIMVPSISEVPLAAVPPPMLANSISYKLPAETSVQLITVPQDDPREKSHRLFYEHKKSVFSSDEQTLNGLELSIHQRSSKKTRTQNSVQKDASDSSVIVLSDDTDGEDDDFVQRFDISLDPSIYPDIDENSNSNDELLAKLNHQRASMHEDTDGRQTGSLNDVLTLPASEINNSCDDDIIVVEQPHMNNFTVPLELEKSSQSSCKFTNRINTLMQPCKKRNSSTFPNGADTNQQTCEGFDPVSSKKSNAANGTIASDRNTLACMANVMRKPMNATKINEANVVKYYSRQVQKYVEVKQSEQQIPNETKNSEDMAKHVVVASSLEAKKGSSTVAVADSTTRSVVKEVLIEAKNDFPTSPDFDVEEQINKITLIVQKTTNRMDLSDNFSSCAGTTKRNSNKRNRCEEKQHSSKKRVNMLENSRKTSNDKQKENELGMHNKNNSLEKNKEKANASDPVRATKTTTVGKKVKLEHTKTDVLRTNDMLSNSKDIQKVVSHSATRITRKRVMEQMKSEENKKLTTVTETVVSSSRPARVSKTLSKYYKGPSHGQIIDSKKVPKIIRNRP